MSIGQINLTSIPVSGLDNINKKLTCLRFPMIVGCAGRSVLLSFIKDYFPLTISMMILGRSVLSLKEANFSAPTPTA